MIPARHHLAVAGALIDKSVKGLPDLHLASFDQGEPCRCSRKERKSRIRLANRISLDYDSHRSWNFHLRPVPPASGAGFLFPGAGVVFSCYKFIAPRNADRIRLCRSVLARPASLRRSIHAHAASFVVKPWRTIRPRSTTTQFPGDISSAFIPLPPRRAPPCAPPSSRRFLLRPNRVIEGRAARA